MWIKLFLTSVLFSTLSKKINLKVLMIIKEKIVGYKIIDIYFMQLRTHTFIEQ